MLNGGNLLSNYEQSISPHQLCKNTFRIPLKCSQTLIHTQMHISNSIQLGRKKLIEFQMKALIYIQKMERERKKTVSKNKVCQVCAGSFSSLLFVSFFFFISLLFFLIQNQRWKNTNSKRKSIVNWNKFHIHESMFIRLLANSRFYGQQIHVH